MKKDPCTGIGDADDRWCGCRLCRGIQGPDHGHHAQHANPYFKTVADVAVAKANELGYEAQVIQHDDDVTKQQEAFETAIQLGAKAIICDNAGADATIAPVQAAKEAGIPHLPGRPRDQLHRRRIAQLVANNYQARAWWPSTSWS